MHEKSIICPYCRSISKCTCEEDPLEPEYEDLEDEYEDEEEKRFCPTCGKETNPFETSERCPFCDDEDEDDWDDDVEFLESENNEEVKQ